MKQDPVLEFRLCIKNDAYPASLAVRKVYEVIPDTGAAARHCVRIVDETGEDYLFPEDCFVPIDVPLAAIPFLAHCRESGSIDRAADRPRAGWSHAFAEMADRGDDVLKESDAFPSTSWDEEEWEWR